jgi:methionine synthase I (cobalamin-dependent)
MNFEVLDGAMGTQLMARGLQLGEPSILWNVSRPADVLGVHSAYARAGAQALVANTFGGSPFALGRVGLADRCWELNAAGVRLARQASGDGIVLGDVGPCGEHLEPYGELDPESLAMAVAQQGAALADAGADGFLVETFSDPTELGLTVTALKLLGLPVYASFSYQLTAVGIRTMSGTDATRCVTAAIEAGADGVGANCGSGLRLSDWVVLAEQLLSQAGDIPVFLKPNAGDPRVTADGIVYDVTPGEFACWASQARSLGVYAIGGCCGTTPDHIRAMQDAPC